MKLWQKNNLYDELEYAGQVEEAAKSQRKEMKRKKEQGADTRQLWEMFKDGKYDVYLSTVTLREIEKCSEPKKNTAY